MFGNTATSTAPFFGNAAQTSGFSFGGANPAVAAASTAPGFTGFGSGVTGAVPTGFNFGGNTTQTTGSSYSFGAKPSTTTGPFSFTPKTTANPGFGFQPGGFKGFGQTPPMQQLQQQQQQQQQQVADPNLALCMAVCAPAYFNDERDEVLKKWNQLQAVWGAGRGFYGPNTPPVEFTSDNPFCRFKAVGYIKMPSYSHEDGFVELKINRKESEVKAHQQQIVETLMKVFNGSQVCVDYVHSIDADKTRMCVFVQQRNANGETKKASSWEVYNHIVTPMHKQTLQNLCIDNVAPLVSLTESQLKEYLEQPPRGIDPMIWEQGKRANPDPKKYLPVAMVGFQELTARFKAQEEESRLLQGQLDVTAEDIMQLQNKQATLRDNLLECKRRQLQMAHRALKLIIRQEVERKRGVPIEQGEEQLRMLLEALQAQLATPTQYMGRLNELLSQISVQPNNNSGSTDQQRFSLDSGAEKDLHNFLEYQQDAIKEIVSVTKKDLEVIEHLGRDLRNN